MEKPKSFVRVNDTDKHKKGWLIHLYPPTFEPTAVGAGTYFAPPTRAQAFACVQYDDLTIDIQTLNNLTAIS